MLKIQKYHTGQKKKILYDDSQKLEFFKEFPKILMQFIMFLLMQFITQNVTVHCTRFGYLFAFFH